MRAAPRRMPQQVHVDAAKEVRPARPQHKTDRFTDALLKVRIERGAAAMLTGKHVWPDDAAARPVRERDAREA